MPRAFEPFRVSIPASSANLGTGFDSIGVALDLRLRADVTPANRFALEFVQGPDAPTHRGFAEAIRGAMHVFSERLPAAHVRVRNAIPLGKGLGSSAAAILLGLITAARCGGRRVPAKEIGWLASELEGHPDNALAALYGGIVVAATHAARAPAYVRVRTPKNIRAIVVVPDVELSTARARAALPARYPRADVVHNTQRAALLAASLASGDLSQLADAMSDVIHQPYRAQLVPGLAEALRFRSQDVLAIALSGAGPSVLALLRSNGAWKRSVSSLCACFGREGVAVRALHLQIASAGATVVTRRASAPPAVPAMP
jgi:homoserine kinase